MGQRRDNGTGRLGEVVFVERVEPVGEQLEDLDTARLVTQIQAGDQAAFSQLYMRYFDRVYSYLRVVLNDIHEAEDAAQQVFMQVLEAVPRYERRGAQPFRAWLFVIVRNYAVARVRKLNRLEPMEPQELNERRGRNGDQEEEMPALDWISDRDLVLFVERLPLPQRQVLLLRFQLDLSNTQVAAVLGRSENEVRVMQHRALRFLRDRLTAVGREPRSGERRPRMARCPQKARVLRERRFALWA
ncbi:MAG: hypothetical protein QOG26_1757 [Solirubrobacterales bacterium]|nr:hypothetical protein [Solirubrobacterales bacterium]